jgi:hypothetical protein
VYNNRMSNSYEPGSRQSRLVLFRDAHRQENFRNFR